jgi:hypothetical protein
MPGLFGLNRGASSREFRSTSSREFRSTSSSELSTPLLRYSIVPYYDEVRPTGQVTPLRQTPPTNEQKLAQIRATLGRMGCNDQSIYELADLISEIMLPQELLQEELQKTMNPPMYQRIFLNFSRDLQQRSLDKKDVYQCALVCALEVKFPNQNTEVINQVIKTPNFKDIINLYLIRHKISSIDTISKDSIYTFADFIREKNLTRKSIVSELEKTIEPNDNSFFRSDFITKSSGDKKMAYQCALLCALGVQFFRYATHITVIVKEHTDFKSFNNTLNESFNDIVKEYIQDKYSK